MPSLGNEERLVRFPSSEAVVHDPGERKHGASVGGGLRESIEEAGVERRKGGDALGGMEALEGEWRSDAVAHEPPDAVAVLSVDAYRRVDLEPCGPPPGERVACRRLVEEIVAPGVTEHAALNGAKGPGTQPSAPSST